MNTMIYKYLISVFMLFSCQNEKKNSISALKNNKAAEVLTTDDGNNGRVITGAERLDLYLPLLATSRVGLVVNQTSMVRNTHLVDMLISQGIDIKRIFSPEHGFRGEADAGEKIKNSVDTKTNIELISLYGKNKKPSTSNLIDIDVILFDIQDVGVRFYTYISTLHYVMEAAAEQNIKVIVLDRPNPNGHYVDGPILEPEYKSFIGMHPVPVVYGMTIGEYAKMINDQGWLEKEIIADLTVIPCGNYTHKTNYILPVKPSPNLPTPKSIRFYPSLCFFEGTTVSVGRGTDAPFQMFGHPNFSNYSFSFKPQSVPGAKFPKHQDETCFGVNLINAAPLRSHLNLDYLIEAYDACLKAQTPFFNDNNFFEKLAGTLKLRNMLESGMTSHEISNTWTEDLKAFKKIRKKYLLYK